jgi:choline dehydrogenase
MLNALCELGLLCSCASETEWNNGNGDFSKWIQPSDISSTAQGFMMIVTLLHPRSTGSVKLRSNKPEDPPVISAGYFLDERDLDTLADGAIQAVELVEKMQFGSTIVLPEDLKHYESNSTELWKEMARRYATTLYHPSSTCAMGKVVDSELKVKGVQGLRVADASVFPHLTSGNTNAPAMLVGEIASDFIKYAHSIK